jgi:hypothetical protein
MSGPILTADFPVIENGRRFLIPRQEEICGPMIAAGRPVPGDWVVADRLPPPNEGTRWRGSGICGVGSTNDS